MSYLQLTDHLTNAEIQTKLSERVQIKKPEAGGKLFI